MRVTGVDLALRATGVARADETFITIKPNGRVAGYHRHWHMAQEILRIVEEDSADLVVFEDYAPHGPGINSTIVLAEVGGVVRSMLTHHVIPFVLVKPNVLKEYATGHGKASKVQMLNAALHECRGDLDHRPANDDEADAYWLRSMARVHYEGGTGLERAGIVARVTWPELQAAG